MSATTSAKPDIRLAREENEVRSCWKAFKELRPHLHSQDEFIERWRAQLGEGYRIVYIAAVSCTQWRRATSFISTTLWPWHRFTVPGSALRS